MSILNEPEMCLEWLMGNEKATALPRTSHVLQKEQQLSLPAIEQGR